ncbi:hypothetical protein niasHS_004969 [Heterodera schachtii]|uniref:Uncharacterized protein n=1 Tax=Heterodera schachtii TaxID=97005 RepID=A0ABD2JQR3_HETSC
MARHGVLGGNIRAVDVRVVDEHGNLIYTPPPATHVPQLLEQFIQDVNSAIGQASTGLMEARVVAAWAHYQLIVDTIHLKIMDRHGALGGNIRAVDMRRVDEHGNFIYTPPPSTHVPELLDQFIHDVNSAIGQVSTGLMEARVVAASCFTRIVPYNWIEEKTKGEEMQWNRQLMPLPNNMGKST